MATIPIDVLVKEQGTDAVKSKLKSLFDSLSFGRSSLATPRNWPTAGQLPFKVSEAKPGKDRMFNAPFAQGKFPTPKEQTNMSKQQLQSIKELMGRKKDLKDITKAGWVADEEQGIVLKRVRDWLGGVSEEFIGIEQGATQARQAMTPFRFEFLNFMFLGQAISKTMSGLLKPAWDLVGVNKVWGTILKVLFLPVMLEILPAMLQLMNYFMGMSEPTKKFIGHFVILSMIVGHVLSSFSMLILTLGSLSKALASLNKAAMTRFGLLFVFIAIAYVSFTLIRYFQELTGWTGKWALRLQAALGTLLVIGGIVAAIAGHPLLGVGLAAAGVGMIGASAFPGGGQQYQYGGLVQHTGLARVHAGETVVPSGAGSGINFAPTINVNGAAGDPRVLANMISDTLYSELRRMGIR